jgi:hypothetical protein
MAQSKDRMIIAQSSLKWVNEWSTNCGKCLTIKEAVRISDIISDYVEKGYTKELGEVLDKIQDHLDNKGLPKKS